ncbi:MAG TPA: 5'-3' exonuclease H3TH domain-containing protein, partial [Elusimicrobiota bacterium]|nr:5'-3' exonuclease H3TH domain-containing protein [Elusimicrobiota bacterium]
MKTAAATRRRLYLVDAHAYLHRAYHALPPLTNSKKEPVGALLGFLRALLVIIRRDKPELLAVCFDAPGPTFRHKELESYKATRKPTEPDLKWQLNAARDVVKATGLPFVEAPGWEADDLMATLAAKGEAEGLDVVLVSGDKDALQLVGGRIRVLNEAKGVVFDPAKVEEKFKVTPAQLVDYLTLTGDVSDNVPGVPGVGAVGAAKLLNRFGDLDALIQAALKGDPDIPARIAKSLVDSQ